MYKIVSTWTGPADKLIIDGKFFRDSFLNLDVEAAWSASVVPGKIGKTTVEMPSPGVVIRTATYDTEEHATAAINLGISRPAENFKDGKDGQHQYQEYITNNNISITSEVIPA